jgi:hypothetical protein
MGEQRFDAALRALGASTGRRQAIAGALGALFGGGALDVLAKSKGKGTGKPGAEGPCGNGSRKANACTNNSQCCTGVCDTSIGKKNKDGKGRCRCVKKGAACKVSKNCCGDLTCTAGVCGKGGPTPPPPPPPCDVCASGCDYTTIEDAIDGTAEGGTILIGPGTWNEGKLFILKSLTIGACDPTDPPVIDSGTDTYGVFTTSWGNETLTFTLSDVELFSPEGNGLSLNSGTTATIERVKIAGSKRGIDVNYANATIKDCTIENNNSDGNGGGIRINGNSTVAVVIENTLIRHNSSNNTGEFDYYGGGGIASYKGLVTLKGTTSITGNTAAANGGGVLLTGGSFTMESPVTITGNSADCYGGLYNEPSSGGYATLGGVSVSTVIGNTATGSCGCNNLSGGGSCNS